eukprot:Awhi_evm1s4329
MHLLKNTTSTINRDLYVHGVIADNEDEAYLNKYFFIYPPKLTLPANYLYPEPPMH